MEKSAHTASSSATTTPNTSRRSSIAEPEDGVSNSANSVGSSAQVWTPSTSQTPLYSDVAGDGSEGPRNLSTINSSIVGVPAVGAEALQRVTGTVGNVADAVLQRSVDGKEERREKTSEMDVETRSSNDTTTHNTLLRIKNTTQCENLILPTTNDVPLLPHQQLQLTLALPQSTTHPTSISTHTITPTVGTVVDEAGAVESRPLHANATRPLKPFSELKDSARRALVNTKAVPKLVAAMQELLVEERRPDSKDEAVKLAEVAVAKLSGAKRTKLPPTELEAAALAASPMMQGWLRSYLQATPRSLEQKRLLSVVALYFTRRAFNALVLQDHTVPVCQYTYTEARRNALELGPGRVPEANKIVRRRLGEGLDGAVDSDFSFAFHFVSQFMLNTAHGTRELPMRHGPPLEIPRIELSTSSERIKTMYHRAVEEQLSQLDDLEVTAGAEPVYPIADAHLDALIRGLSGGRAANLTALDSAYWRLCMVNFDRFRFLIELATVDRAELRTTLHRRAEKVEAFLTHEYCKHLCDTSLCRTHSKTFAFGQPRSAPRGDDDGVDDAVDQQDSPAALDAADDFAGGSPLSPPPELRCRGCDQTFIFVQDVDRAIRTATLKPQEETADQLLTFLHSTLASDMCRYMGHIVRKTHDAGVVTEILSRLDRSCGVLIRSDYRNKTTALVQKEPMVDYFGKRGISDLGFSFTFFRHAASAAAITTTNEDSTTTSLPTARSSDVPPQTEKYESEMATLYYDCWCDDAKEDWEAITQTSLAVFERFRAEFPHVTKAVMCSDGAGAFSGTEVALMCASVGKRVGLFVQEQHITEPGNGKSKLDAHFAMHDRQACGGARCIAQRRG